MIPAFDIHGVVPPIRPGQAGHSVDRAPYRTDILTFCAHFGDSPARRAILSGLLELREDLRTGGIVEGFQWLDGSFAEDVERLRGRAPADIDAVTFCAFGDRTRQMQLLKAAPEAFDSQSAKAKYSVDHYFVQTDMPNDATGEALTTWVAYWYSMWAHQRGTERWKGFVSVPLGSNDLDARAWLAQQSQLTPQGGGTP